MFIGLNPSTANENKNDPTINRVCAIANNNGFGGVYMMNIFPSITAYPEELVSLLDQDAIEENWQELQIVSKKCSNVVFAWGNFKQITRGDTIPLMNLFPGAKCLRINKNGSPKHPLYCKADTKFIDYQNKQP